MLKNSLEDYLMKMDSITVRIAELGTSGMTLIDSASLVELQIVIPAQNTEPVTSAYTAFSSSTTLKLVFQLSQDAT